MHLRTIGRLDEGLRQSAVNILIDHRIEEWEETLEDHLSAARTALVGACHGAGDRFEEETLEFQERCFSRIGALFFRLKEYRKRAGDIVGKAHAEEYDVANVAVLNGEWDAGDDVDACVAGLMAIVEEATTFMVAGDNV